MGPRALTDEAGYGRLLDRLGNHGLRDARQGFAVLGHPAEHAAEPIWAASHDRAVVEWAWSDLEDAVQSRHEPGLPPVDNYEFYRLLGHPDQWLRVQWWAWLVAGILTEDELAVWNAWRKEWWPRPRPPAGPAGR